MSREWTKILVHLLLKQSFEHTRRAWLTSLNNITFQLVCPLVKPWRVFIFRWEVIILAQRGVLLILAVIILRDNPKLLFLPRHSRD